LGVLGHLGPLVPRQGAAQLVGEGPQGGHDRIPHGGGAVAGEGRAVLDAWPCLVGHAGQAQEQGEAARPFDAGVDP
jgi:hypothetical protein